MALYRRQRISGATYFFTLALNDRSQSLLVDHIDALRLAYASVQARHPFRTEAIVVLPEHLHCLWSLPQGDPDYSIRWSLVKTRFTKALIEKGLRIRRRRRNERYLWQPRFWEHVIRDDADLSRHIDYIHFNPVKHGLTDQVSAWPHSSFHRFCAEGKLPKDWAGVLESCPKKGE